jgi:L-alanine-DL-glutamate epimerase-like enolase superfamily enzyme
MRVTDVETFVVDADWRNWFFVRVETDEGITGVGEALSGEGLTAALEAAAEAHKHYVIGEDPLNRARIGRKLRRYPFAWRAGKLINAVAAAVDIALWDIAGKHYGEPVWKLLGGKVRDEIPVYANGWHIGERTPENYARHAEKAVEQGYPALKCDPFAHYEGSLTDDQLAEVADLLEAVRDAVGPDVGIALDCHGRFTRRGAIEVADALAGEVENLHRLLTDEDVSRGNRIEAELRLERADVDVAAVRRDFVSHQTVYNYLTDVRGVERGDESGPDTDHVRSRVGRLAGRLEAVAADGLESLADAGALSLGSVRVNVRVAVYCDDCGRQFDLPTLFERGRCACDGE